MISRTNFVSVAQIGAREHYGVARMLQSFGLLSELYTDYWVSEGGAVGKILGALPLNRADRMLGRFHPDIPVSKVKSFPLSSAFTSSSAMKFLKGVDRTERYRSYITTAKAFSSRVGRQLRRQKDPGVFIGYSSASLEAFQAVSALGTKKILCVAAPVHVEEKIIKEECEKFPSLVSAFEPIPMEFLERLENEWALADLLVVNSSWSLESIVKYGAPKDKIRVVPLAYEPQQQALDRKTTSLEAKRSKLRVLWLGTLSLRKGIQYLLEAAREFDARDIKITIAGPSDISMQNLDLPTNCTYIGQVPRTRVHSLWSNHDVFILPTLSDGFAITLVEAQAYGLPIICTKNCGEVVSDGDNGIIVPSRSASEIAQSFRTLISDRALLKKLSANTDKIANNFSLSRVGDQWSELITELLQ